MRSNELRIGNYVNTWRKKHKGIISYELEFVCIDANELIDILYEGYEPEPIPLTEEWSVKFGYECLVDMACDFSCKSLYPIEITSEDLKLMKVNEAQNLYLDLTGEELTIKE
jgi:hypothetical protein